MEKPYIITTKKQNQLRFGIIGAPFAGKSTAALTFPNPIFLDFDHKAPPGSRSIEFFSNKTARQFLKTNRDSATDYTPRYALIDFLKQEAKDFGADTTLVIDSWTSLMNRLDAWQRAVEQVVYWSKKKQDVDGFAVHGDRLAMGVEIMEACKELTCNIVFLFHEQVDRSEKGDIIPGSMKPLMKGQFSDQFSAHITTYVRQVHSPKYPTNGGYYWRVKPDDAFRPSLPPGFVIPDNGAIDATYQAFTNCIK